jgi:putative AlgH/UPF0301 family transcriptional regulator
LLIDGGADWTKDTSVTLAVYDQGSGAAQMSFSTDNGTWSEWETYATSKSYTLSAGDGAKTVYVHLKDAAGNMSSMEISDTITLDTEAPIAPTLTAPDAPAQEVTVTIEYSPDTAVKEAQIDGNPSFTYTEPFTVSANGTVTAYATDAAGNTSSAQLSITNIDTTPPTGTIQVNDGADWTKELSVAITLDDQESGAAQMSFFTDNGTWSEWETYATSKPYTLSAGDGAKTVYVRLQDAAGNMSSMEISDTITLDTEAPVAPTLTASDAPAQEVTVTIEYPSDTAVKEAQVDGNPTFTYTEPFTVSANGTVTAYATDAAGNTSSAQLTITNIDTAPPTGTLLINDGADWTKELSVALTLDDQGNGAVQMSFSMDNTNWSDWETYATSRSYTLSAGDGAKTVYVRLKDAAGNMSSKEISDTITMDTEAPVAPTLIASDAPAQEVRITIGYSSDTAIKEAQFDGNSAFTYTEPFTVSANGTVTAYATDEAGNTSSAQLTITNIDTTPPTGTIQVNDGADWTKELSVALTLDDQESGAAQMSFSTNSGTWSDWETYATSKSYSLSAGDGVKTVYVRFKDAAGNESTTEISDTITLDTTVPTAPTLTATEAPAQEATVTIEYSLDTVIKEAQIDENATFTYTEPFTMSANGTVTAYATDAAGNTSSAQLTITNIDTTPPTGTIQVNNGADWTKEVSVALTLDDQGSGAAQMSFSTDNTNWSDWETFATSKSYTLLSGDGAKTVYIRIKDAAGNESTTEISDSITLDTTAPTAPTLTAPDAQAQEVTVTIEYSSDTATKEAQIDGNPLFAYTEPFTVSANGTVTAYATDEAGNTSSARLTITNIDTTPPTGTIQINNGADWTKEVSVALTLDDQGSGATQMSFSTYNTNWSDWETFATSKSYTLPTGDGSITVYARLQDAAGNMSTMEISDSITLDTTAPAAPTLTTSDAPAQEVTVTIEYSSDTVIKEAHIDENATFTYTEPFTVSANGTITAYATDEAGNTSSAQLTITNIDTTPPTGSIQINNGDEKTKVTTVTLTLDDQSSGAVQIGFSNDNATWSDWEPFSTAKSYILPTGDGTKAVYARLMDAAGNISSVSISDSITLDTVPPATIVSVVSNAEGNLLTILFDTAIHSDFTATGLSLKGTAATITDHYEITHDGRAITFHLSPAISETNEVTLQVADGTFQGVVGEEVEGNTFPVFTPNALANLKTEAAIGDPAFTVDDVVNAIGKHLNVVGDDDFDRYDAQFWLNLIESRIPTSQTPQKSQN